MIDRFVRGRCAGFQHAFQNGSDLCPSLLVNVGIQRRANELNNLANLTQALNSIRDPQDLYNHLVQSIIPLIDIDIVGFLIYNENTRKLEAQQPFVGVPPNFVDLYNIPIPQDSPAERVWQKQETIIAPDITADQRLIDLGADQFARAAGIMPGAIEEIVEEHLS